MAAGKGETPHYITGRMENVTDVTCDKKNRSESAEAILHDWSLLCACSLDASRQASQVYHSTDLVGFECLCPTISSCVGTSFVGESRSSVLTFIDAWRAFKDKHLSFFGRSGLFTGGEFRLADMVPP